jgi:hypothetical protein
MKAQQQLEGYRISPQQRRLWRQQERATGEAFRAVCVLRVHGELDGERLYRAAQRVSARHEILRTRLGRLPGMELPLQCVESESACEWLSCDGERVRIELSSLHGDARSLELLVEELARAYAGGEEAGWEAVQYVEAAEWQSELLEASATEAGRQYWRRQELSGAVTDAGGRFEPRQMKVEIESATAAALLEIGRARGLRADATLLACWQTLLWRLRGEEFTVVAVVCDPRREEVSGALGLLCRHVPVRVRLEAQTRWSEVAAQTQSQWDAAEQWQEQFEQEGSYWPWSFEWLGARAPVTAGEVEFEIEELCAVIDRFQWKLRAREWCGGIEAWLDYDGAQVDRAEAEALAGQMARVLGEVAATPEQAIGRIPVLGRGEREKLLLFSASETAVEGVCVHQAVEEQAARRPEAVALVCGSVGMNYGELNARANQLARWLRRHYRTGPEARVALLLERSEQSVMAMLGVLKAGGVYVVL